MSDLSYFSEITREYLPTFEFTIRDRDDKTDLLAWYADQFMPRPHQARCIECGNEGRSFDLFDLLQMCIRHQRSHVEADAWQRFIA